MKLSFFIIFLSFFLSCNTTTSEVDYFELTVESVTPDSGVISGNEEVTIMGKGFSNSCKIYLGEKEVEIESISKDKLVFKTPKVDKGGYTDIKIDCRQQTVIIKDRFRYYGLSIHYQNISKEKHLNKYQKYEKIESLHIDKDNLKDLLLYLEDSIIILLQQENGKFKIEELPFEYIGKIKKMLVEDIDGDSIKEWIILGEDLSIYKLIDNKYQKTVFFPKGEDLSDIKLLDIDNDKDKDIILISTSNKDKEIFILINEEQTFTDKTQELLTVNKFKSGGITFGDLNDDNSIDIFIAGDGETNYLLLNDGEGKFNRNNDIIPKEDIYNFNQPLIKDFNQDGKLDIYLTSKGKDKIYLQQKDGIFKDRTDKFLNPLNKSSKKVIFGDIDGDQCIDSFTIYEDGSFTLWHNDCENHFYNYSSKLDIKNLKDGIFIDFDNDNLDELILIKKDFNKLFWFKNIYKTFEDTDNDGVDNRYDNCPEIKNVDQLNSDSFHFSCIDKKDCLDRYSCSLVLNPNQKAYLICENSKKSWQEANYFCHNLGGKLVEIDSQELDDFLTSKISSDCYIGLTDLKEEGDFVWKSGMISDFLNWDNNQPDNYKDNENCVTIRKNGNWNDLNCSRKASFICEDTIEKEENFGDSCDECPYNINLNEKTSCGGCDLGYSDNNQDNICDNRSCKTIFDSGVTKDGIYIIDPDGVGGEEPFNIYCDMTTNGGVWSVIAVSYVASDEDYFPFNKNWDTVENIGVGNIGDIKSNYFISMKKYLALANQESKVDYVWYAKSGKPEDPWEKTLEYKNHYLEESTYRWQGEEVWALDAFTYYPGQKLTTNDSDNDMHETTNCANSYKSFGWYKKCHSAHYWSTTTEKNDRGGEAVANGYTHNGPDAAGTYNSWYELKIMVR